MWVVVAPVLVWVRSLTSRPPVPRCPLSVLCCVCRNFTDRGSATCHNDIYRGKGNGIYRASNMRSNQGFASVKTTFPKGSFATCVYPDNREQQRGEHENTWHPQFPGVAETPAVMPAVPYNTTGTKPLPIPFSQRPGYDEEERLAAEAKRQKYLAFKAMQLSSVGGDKIPADFHEHTISSAVHDATQHRPGQLFRPSKERVGTTPMEREAAAKKLAESQAAAEEAGRQEYEAARQAEERARSYQQPAAYRPAAYDPTRATRTNGQQPTYYNVPVHTQNQGGFGYQEQPRY